MHLNLLVDEDNKTVATRGSSFYTATAAKETLNAEILNVAKIREVLMASFQTIVTTTSSTSIVSSVLRYPLEQQQEDTRLLEKWDTKAWMPTEIPERFLLPFGFVTSSEQTSRQKETSVAEQIRNVRTNLDLPFSERLAARFEYLVETSEEEFPEQEPMSPRSLQDFLAFIRSVPSIAYPDVVLTYGGNVRAEWTKARNRHFAVEFLGGNDVRFVIFAPDPKAPYKTNRASGLSTLDSLLEHVHPYGVVDWITSRNKNEA